MAEAVTATMRLRIVRDVQEDESGATVHFQEGSHGRLAHGDPTYTFRLRLLRRKERQHPAGVSINSGGLIPELVRADITTSNSTNVNVPRRCRTMAPLPDKDIRS
jgi:hypothetical protein